MPLVNSKQILFKAMKGDYAVPAFNAYNMESIRAIINVSSRLNKDVIIAFSESAIKYAGLDLIVKMVKNLSKNAKNNISLHLDHGKDMGLIKKAIRSGFTSVMFDGSALSFDENVKNTFEVVQYAKKYDVSVEAELGKIIGTEDIINSENEHFTDPDEAKLFIQKTKADSLAISIGTKHGINKATKTPKINFEVIDAVAKKIPQTPLVAHGSSSVPLSLVDGINTLGGQIKKAQGISEQTLRMMAKTHIAKINVDTDLRLAFTYGIRKELSSHPETFDPRTILSSAQLESEKQIEHIFEILS